MLTFVLLPLLLAAPASPDAAELALAESFAAAGEMHLKQATTSAEHPITEFQAAHTDFDSAYLIDGAVVYLCRALAVANTALRTATFADEQGRLFWEETRQDDLDRLQKDATETGRANCRFDATGKPPPPRVAMIDEADIPARPAPSAPTTDAEHAAPTEPSRAQLRRSQAHTAAGAMLTGAGVGMLGLVAGVLELERQRSLEMRGMIVAANAANRYFTEIEVNRFRGLADDLLRGRDVAIGVGVAGLVTLGTGIALLATRKKTRTRAYALQPYGGPQGVGALLRLRF
ncbi:MAG: hypothetical protein H0T76_09020 [Nannocystis sp.]|nr:hypothetical protein [Nannocystis sp.]MBA3546610.1 hypothetical protein [Nannocystis sp.]